ncbi:MAG: hypothetical protein H7318_20380 [Oligoflexus sp.]|nr:hypothetical protein [Oligoflexus sp.]
MNTCIPSLISLKGSNLHIGQHIVALHGRKKTRLLLEAMLKAGSHEEGLHREQLKREVYSNPALPQQTTSSRLRESQDGSLSKLISRSRSFLKESLRDTAWSHEVDWFVYSEKNRKWQLMRNRA